MIIKAYAKINLGLDVVRKRADGYHDVKMIMQTIDVFDTLDIKLGIENGENTVSLGGLGKISVVCGDENVPCGETNLVCKSAKAFLEYTGKKADISVKIEKNIPVGAGLAGGSTDAAAVLRALNVLLKTDLSDTELMKIAKNIGADVPFCVVGNTYLAEGIGEILTPVKSNIKFDILLVKPPFSVSTPSVYKSLVLDENTTHPDIDKIKNALEDGNVSVIYENLGNTLEDVTLKMYGEVGKIKENLKNLGASAVLMSGSGPSVFAIFGDRQKLDGAYKIMKEKYKQTYLTSTINNV
ncbi:4-(cytidine 5'-diphospho)-2-C-methyl-D-erythritol kinase [Qingrenia yutianensis]|uniref:4-diphosphocytidyl-2-C-methyl-D-erythritol kinase n=1 Tax=Qingrenia yutianensis TaxID=2763676 RepID=A0A926F791_9FIRM|nr:4-(cytidine 5'-diphospho)-2-C-methyl-D-erythritol kinase [Qingrenia yutianensis]MBC8595280.1 4-(cytidine 5'-diphospho)-2-C-methyl-D-erythritol kinase [Qingrenia yutianensis]